MPGPEIPPEQPHVFGVDDTGPGGLRRVPTAEPEIARHDEWPSAEDDTVSLRRVGLDTGSSGEEPTPAEAARRVLLDVEEHTRGYN